MNLPDNTKPAILVHPPLGLFESQLMNSCEVVHWPTDRKDIRAAITLGHVGISNAMIDALPQLGVIICFGVGVDGVDLAHCKARNIAVTHGRDINHEDVADLAIGLVIAVARGLSEGERVLRTDAWRPPIAVPPRRRLRGRKFGIVGMGAIGQAIAARAAPFGVEIKWQGPRAKPGIAYPYEPDLRALAEWADILVIAAKGDQGLLVTADIIKALGPDGMLINIARGSLVDEDALIAALKSGALGAAGLDVFAEEPTPASRWADVLNVTPLPHLGGVTRESLYAGSQNVLENLRRFYAGEPLLTPIEA